MLTTFRLSYFFVLLFTLSNHTIARANEDAKGETAEGNAQVQSIQKQMARWGGNSERHRNHACSPTAEQPTSASNLEFELLRAKVDLMVLGNLFGFRLQPDLLPCSGCSGLCIEGDEDGSCDYFFWRFLSNGGLSEQETRQFVSMAFLRLSLLLTESHISAHCITVKTSNAIEQKEELSYFTLDTDHNGLITQPESHSTRPRPQPNRRKVIKAWLEKRVEIDKEIQELERKINMPFDGTSAEDFSSRVKEMEAAYDRILLLQDLKNREGPVVPASINKSGE